MPPYELRRFELRYGGVVVAEGMRLPYGTVVLRWLGEVPAVHMWAGIEAVEAAHCRDGIQLAWLDEPTEE